MKKFLALSCLAVLVFGSSCKKDTTAPGTMNSVSTDYKAFIIEFTATWCPYCGTNGYPNWDPTFANHLHKVTGISAHPADGLVTADYPEQAALQTFYGCTGYPTTGYNQNGNGYPSSTYFDCINAPIAANAQAKAGIGLTEKVDGNNMVVTTKTVFFQDVTAKINLAVYLTEDALVYNQTTTTTTIQNAVHNHVFRGAAGQNAFGTTIITSAASKGTQIDGSYTIPIPADVVNKNNLHVVVVLFTVDASGNPTNVVNSNTLDPL
jgi:hypothetical protein